MERTRAERELGANSIAEFNDDCEVEKSDLLQVLREHYSQLAEECRQKGMEKEARLFGATVTNYEQLQTRFAERLLGLQHEIRLAQEKRTELEQSDQEITSR